MANTRSGNVIIVDTDAAFTEQVDIVGIRYVAGTGSPSVVIKADSSNGTTVYENANSSSEFNQVKLSLRTGFHVNVEGTGTKVYLYLEP